MQFNIVDDDVVAPIYTCGKRGESIDVQVHGVNYTTWKLLDNFEKHIGKRPKISCKICHDRKNSFEQLMETMIYLGNIATQTSVSLDIMSEVFNKISKANK